jgi:hypothetical protein
VVSVNRTQALELRVLEPIRGGQLCVDLKEKWSGRKDLNLRPPGPELGLDQPKSLSWRHLRFSGRSQLDKFGQVPVDVLVSQLR